MQRVSHGRALSSIVIVIPKQQTAAEEVGRGSKDCQVLYGLEIMEAMMVW